MTSTATSVAFDRISSVYAFVQKQGELLWANGPTKGETGRAAWQPFKNWADATFGGLECAWAPYPSGKVAESAKTLLALLTHLEKTLGATTQVPHFAAKILSLPAAHPCVMRRLLQVAFNAGQLAGAASPGELAPVARAAQDSDLTFRTRGAVPFRVDAAAEAAFGGIDWERAFGELKKLGAPGP